MFSIKDASFLILGPSSAQTYLCGLLRFYTAVSCSVYESRTHVLITPSILSVGC